MSNDNTVCMTYYIFVDWVIQSSSNIKNNKNNNNSNTNCLLGSHSKKVYMEKNR